MATIEELARRQMRLAKLSKRLDERKKEVRQEFFQIADQDVPDYMLPTTSIRVPKSFFSATSLTHEQFLKTRFPAYELQASQEQEDDIVFVLKLRKEFAGYSQQENGLKLARSVSMYTPEIDWDSMQKADPELFEMFAVPVTTYELNTNLFQHQMQADPNFDAQGFLARHSIHKSPALRVLASEIDEDE